MDIRKFFGVPTAKRSGAATAGSSKKSKEKDNKNKSKDDPKRKSSKMSDSDEEYSKERKRKTSRKKSKTIIESDSDEEPLPSKIRKKSKEVEKKMKEQKSTVISSDEEDALPSRLQQAAKNDEKQKKPRIVAKSPVKMITNVSEYFGSKPVERTMKKLQKRKERPEEVSEPAGLADVKSNSNSESDKKLRKEESSPTLEQPAKKAKKVSLESQEPPSKKPKSETITDSGKTTPSKKKYSQENTSGIESQDTTKLSSYETPDKKTSVKKLKTPEKQTDNKTSPKSKTDKPKLSPVKATPKDNLNNRPSVSDSSSTPKKTKQKVAVASDTKKHSSSSKPSTPDTPKSTPGKTEGDDVVPSSLERKFSGYRNFMMREGPKALGSKEIPRGSETCLSGNTFVVSGILESIEREDVVELIKRHGGKVTQAVSKKTSYLVLGRDPGNSKIEKAEKLGTKQINEDELFDLIRQSQPPLTKPNEETKTTRNDSSQDHGSSQFTEQSESQTSVDEFPSQAGYSQSSAFSSTNSTPATQTPIASPHLEGGSGESSLWVDKYKPTILKNIIGQQGDRSNVNKLLRWLQNWQRNLKSKPKGGFFAGKDDGSIFKAALLSGPPGVGKTTSAQLVCKEAGFSFVEFNASDSRSKKTLEQLISELLDNKTMDGYFRPAAAKSSSSKHVLIMDEVDGMAGNEDRGGMQELINLIKITKIPVICMCNDRNSQKVRSLANYCFDLRFQRPKVDQIKARMMSIAHKEHLSISPAAMEKIVLGANQDVRQVLHNLSMWTSKQKTLSYDEAKMDAERAHKDIKMGPFDVTRKIFSFEESSKMTIQDQFSLFFNDYSLIPLFSQENYLQAVPYSAGNNVKKTLKCVSDAADSYCNSDLVEKCIRSNGSWNLLPLQAFFSCVFPGNVMRGRMGQRIEFPCWLGKNSTTTKNSRILQELVSHAQLSISGSKNELNLDYIPHLRNVLSTPLINATTEDCSSKVSEVIEMMDNYHFMKEDWEGIMDVGLFEGKQKPQTLINSKVKAAFTRTYNKASHLNPYASNVSAKKKAKKSATDLESGDLDTNAPETGSESDDDIEHNSMIKVKKGGKNKTPATSSSKQARGKGSGKGKGKNKK